MYVTTKYAAPKNWQLPGRGPDHRGPFITCMCPSSRYHAGNNGISRLLTKKPMIPTVSLLKMRSRTTFNKIILAIFMVVNTSGQILFVSGLQLRQCLLKNFYFFRCRFRT